MPSIADKRAAFARLHQAGCFVMPNPWDIGSARFLEGLGFKALATTSAGMAWSKGLADGGVTREAVLAHVAELSAAADAPLNVDFENGFAADTAGVAESVRLCVEAGASGLSIEDYTGDPGEPFYPVEVAAERIRAARAAIDATGHQVILTGRSEGLLRAKPPLEEVIARLKAYADAGADCLYAPAITTRAQIEEVVEAVAPKPVNVLIGFPTELTVAELADLGVRRISVGGALAKAAWAGFMTAAREIAEAGSFASFAHQPPTSDITRPMAR